MRALHTAATGMMAQELNVQVISNNIANMRTSGYKRQRAEFQDLLYEHVSRVGTQTSAQGNILPVGIELGGGVKTVGTPRVMTQGTMLPTGNTLDLAIRGEGLFKIQMPDGTFTYTRDGSFQMDAQGRIVTPQGNVVQPGITIPQNSTSITINAAGPGLGDRAGHRPRRRCSARSRSPASSTRPACRRSATTCSSRRPASGTPQDGTARDRRPRRPAAGQPRAGQCRGGHRDFRPDLGAARLRDECQGHQCGRPDAAGDRQPDALRRSAMIRIAPLARRTRARDRDAGRRPDTISCRPPRSSARTGSG